MILLKKRADTALIYVCRREKLQKDLQKNGVKEFLKKYGYENTDEEEAIACLKARLNLEEKFPHEIGLFLGYPLGDVIGFIENAGKVLEKDNAYSETNYIYDVSQARALRAFSILLYGTDMGRCSLDYPIL
mgnify:CR=1 FL=1